MPGVITLDLVPDGGELRLSPARLHGAASVGQFLAIGYVR
jgi:hypothetical protein